MDIPKISPDLLDVKEIEKQPLQQPTNRYPEIKYEIPQMKLLREAFEQRWRSLATRSERIGIPMPDKEALWKKVMDSWNSGFKCNYCGNKMKLIESPPSPKTFTLEHELAIHNGGDNSLQNVFIICKDCNTKKNTLSASTFYDVLSGKKHIVPGLSIRLSDFFKINRDGWTSEYLPINILLRHLGRRSKSVSTRKNYLQHLRSFCLWVRMKPDEIVQLPKEKIEKLVQQYADTYNTPHYSRRTANNVVTILRSFFDANGYRGMNALNVEGYYTPKRYRKTNDYIPQKHEIYNMADNTKSLRDRSIILTIYSSALRNSTLRALRYKDIKNELLQGLSIIKIPVYPEMKDMDPDACKNGLPYYVFICEEASDAIRLYLQDRTEKYGPINDDDPLFSSECHQIERELRSSKILTARQIQLIVKSAAKDSRIERWMDVKPHCLRKACESVLHGETVDGNHLDPKVQEFFIGHTLEGCQDNYFDSTWVETLRMEYSKLKFERVVVENKFKQMRRAVAQAFDGSGVDIESLIDEYVERKNRLKTSLGSSTGSKIFQP
jgi:integrase/5-methylcytosine-specific restriction endonuclease McrA